jgi:hypothetical protein
LGPRRGELLLEHYHGSLREDDHGTAIDSDVSVCGNAVEMLILQKELTNDGAHSR